MNILDICDDLLQCQNQICQFQHPRYYQGICIKFLKKQYQEENDEDQNELLVQKCDNNQCQLHHPNSDLFISWKNIESINGITIFNLCPQQCNEIYCKFAHRKWVQNICINNFRKPCRNKQCILKHIDWKILREQVYQEYNFYDKNPENLCEIKDCNCERHLPQLRNVCISYLKGTCPKLICQQNHQIWEDIKNVFISQFQFKPCIRFKKLDSYIDLQIEAKQQILQLYCEQQALNRFKQSLKESNFIDLLFILDLTKSMDSWKNEIEKNIIQLIEKFKQTTKGYAFRVGFVGYRDICDDVNIVYRNFTQKINEITLVIHQESAYGGGDIAEDIISGLEQGLKLNICRHENSILCTFLICDAPCHGKQYHNLDSDDYPDQPDKILEQIMEKYKKIKKFSYFTCIKINDSTDKMFECMQNAFPGLFVTQKIEPNEFENLVHFSITKSIQLTSNNLNYQHKNDVLYIESKFTKFKVQEMNVPSNIKYEFWRGYLDNIQSYNRKGDTTLEINLNPENKETNQNTYIFKIFDAIYNSQMITKISKEHYIKYLNGELKQQDIDYAEEQAKVRYSVTAIANQMAYHYRQTLNKNNNYPPIFYVYPILYTFEEPVFGVKVLYAETYIEIFKEQWRKYSTNGSFTDAQNYYYSAFSHFSLNESKGNLVIVDLQGSETIFTDASIQTTKGFIPFLENDQTNRLDQGILIFKNAQHKECNELCQILQLDRNNFYNQNNHLDKSRWKQNNNEYISIICKTCNDYSFILFESYKKQEKIQCENCFELEQKSIDQICRCCQKIYKFAPNVDLLTQTNYGYCEMCKNNCYQKPQKCHYCQFKCQYEIKKVCFKQQDYWLCNKAIQFLQQLQCQVCQTNYDFQVLLDPQPYSKGCYKCQKHM